MARVIWIKRRRHTGRRGRVNEKNFPRRRRRRRPVVVGSSAMGLRLLFSRSSRRAGVALEFDL